MTSGGQLLISQHSHAPEAREKIFLPFFTTEKEGSGIGLALSKQILRKHGGSLRLDSGPGDELTVFALRF